MADGGYSLDPALIKIWGLQEKAKIAENGVMTKNIYKRGVFEKLAAFSTEIQVIARETRLEFEDVLKIADIKDPFEILKKSMDHWDKMLSSSEILPEEQLIDQLQKDFGITLKNASKVFVPTDEMEFIVEGDGTAEEREKGEDVNRVGLALETLLHMSLGNEKILIDDLELNVGAIPENSSRTRPYWVIDLKKFKIGVLVNNQYANRTFVFRYKSKHDLERLSGYTKDQLKTLADDNAMIHHFIFQDPAQFSGELAAALQRVYDRIEMAKPYVTYEEASAAAQALGIQSNKEYRKRHKEDPKLPSNPDTKYKEKFTGWGDFLGITNNYDRAQEVYQTYEEARAAVHALKIPSWNAYRAEYRKDPRLPSAPAEKYGDAFVSWMDFLGTQNIYTHERAKDFYTYEEAKAAKRALGIKNRGEYLKRYKEDSRLPSNPGSFYGEHYNVVDFFGQGRVIDRERLKNIYPTYEEAKAAAQKLGISGQVEYRKRYKEDPRLVGHPEMTYKASFVNWGDFLATGKSRQERTAEIYTTIEEAKVAVQKLGIQSGPQYRARYKEDPGLPASPAETYGESFLSWVDFLGKNRQ